MVNVINQRRKTEISRLHFTALIYFLRKIQDRANIILRKTLYLSINITQDSELSISTSKLYHINITFMLLLCERKSPIALQEIEKHKKTTSVYNL